MGAGWGTLTCLIVAFVKVGEAKKEMRQRKEAERAARAEERRVAAEDHAQRMSEYEAHVEELTKMHASAVAQAEVEYRREWVTQDQEYQKAYNEYLAKKRVCDDAQSKYAEQVKVWNAELGARTNNEDRARRELNASVEKLEMLLSAYGAQVNIAFPALDAAKQRFEKARSDELADMRALDQRRQELQLRQFLATQLIQNADIPNIGSGRKATLSAYGIGSALEVHAGMSVPGFGDALVANLVGWRRYCESRFRYNPNSQLPAAEVNAVRIKHAQTKQSALEELREGAAKLDNLDTKTRVAVSRAKLEILNLARAHAQAIADLTACA